MIIARKKRRENIAEYILYLWQLEDLLRALEGDPEKVYSTLVEPHQNLTEQQKQDIFAWYMDMVNLMAIEAKAEHGHGEHTIHLINDLNDLHLHLLKSPAGKEYAPLFAKLAPELETLRSKLGKAEMNDVELAFRALYSVMLYRIKGDQNQEYISGVIDLVSPVVAKLAQIFHAAERGEIDLYKEE